MTVYVDDMYKTAMGSYGRMKMSHMIADSVEELHKMADAIGMNRKWFQSPPKASWPHYDISMSMRSKAISLGAKDITMRELVTIIQQTRLIK